MSTSKPTEPPPPAGAFWIRIPAVLAIALCLLAGACLLRWNPATIQLRYEGIAMRALEANDLATARVAGTRLLELGPGSRNFGLFALARTNFAIGHNEEAAGMIRQVAPLDRPVFAPAHLFVARSLMSRANPSPAIRAAILAHLHHALVLEPDSEEAKALLERFEQHPNSP